MAKKIFWICGVQRTKLRGDRKRHYYILRPEIWEKFQKNSWPLKKFWVGNELRENFKKFPELKNNLKKKLEKFANPKIIF